MQSPDYAALQLALPDRVPEDQNPPVLPLHELGDQILAVSEAQPRVGKSGVFGYVYGTLTHVLGDMVDGKPEVRHLPRIENPDDLTRQANYFARTWFDPVGDYAEQALAGQRGDTEMQKKIVNGIDDHWLYSLEAPEVQFGEGATQFAAGGMEGHILADLGKSLVRSRVSFSYMAPGGDYDKVNQAIRYVTTLMAPELIEGRPSVVRTAVQPVATVIGGMRAIARRTHVQLLRAENQAEFDAIQDRAIDRALWASQMTARYGDMAIKLFARMAGAKQIASRLGGGHSLPDVV
jgi:hypothetical protein